MPKLAQHYTDPRLVVLYDIENTRGADFDFYLDLAAEMEARTIIDFGCGTGALTVELALDGRRVIGIDPAAGMLDIARRRTGAEKVEWVEGDATALGTPEANLIIMTGNVAQVFLNDAEWSETLRQLHDSLRSGGVLAFESRNPDDRAWERWTPEATYEEFDSPNGPMSSWLEVNRVEEGLVYMTGHNVFKTTGETLLASDTLRFRSQEELRDSLEKAGFKIEDVYGNWQREPFMTSSRLMIFVARRG